MRQVFWCALQGAIIAGLYAFLRFACSDCAPISAGVLATLAAFIVTITAVGLYDLAVSVRGFIRSQQRLHKRGSGLSAGAPLLGFSERRSGANHLTELRRLPPR